MIDFKALDKKAKEELFKVNPEIDQDHHQWFDYYIPHAIEAVEALPKEERLEYLYKVPAKEMVELMKEADPSTTLLELATESIFRHLPA